MKRLISIIGIVFLISAFAAPLMAHGPGWGRGDRMKYGSGGGPEYCPFSGSRYERVTDEQREKLDTLHKKFYDETAPLMNDLRTKRNELTTLLNAVEPDVNTAKAMQKEISDIQAKLAEKRIEFEFEARKINPDVRFSRGYGRHMMEYGYGKRQGWHRGGYGSGDCWN